MVVKYTINNTAKHFGKYACTEARNYRTTLSLILPFTSIKYELQVQKLEANNDIKH